MTNEEMDRLTEDLGSKAAKVRALNAAGVPTGDIGRYLKIRYQHVYNVLLRAGVIEKAPPEPADILRHADDGVIMARIGSSGGIELPADIMARYNLVAGETVFCRALPEGLFILSREAALREVTQTAREKMPEQAALMEALLNLQSHSAKTLP